MHAHGLMLLFPGRGSLVETDSRQTQLYRTGGWVETAFDDKKGQTDTSRLPGRLPTRLMYYEIRFIE